MFINTFLKISEQFWSVTVSATEARHNHGALLSCNQPVTAHCNLAPVQSVVRASRRRWILAVYPKKIDILLHCPYIIFDIHTIYSISCWIVQICSFMSCCLSNFVLFILQHCPYMFLVFILSYSFVSSGLSIGLSIHLI